MCLQFSVHTWIAAKNDVFKGLSFKPVDFLIYLLQFMVVWWMCTGSWDLCILQHKCNGTHVQCGRHITSGAYANNVQCMYASDHGHIFHWIEFI